LRRAPVLLLVVVSALLTGLAAAGALAGSGGGTTTGGKSVRAAAARDRSVTDMPDDVSGPQIHFLYVVPSDGADGQLDTNGVIEQSIARIERWFVGQAGAQGLRVDTYNGVPDITFVRMPHSDAQATSINPWPLWVMGEDLVAAGFNDPAKVYAAFYDGHSAWACGGAKSPALPKLGAMYLKGWPTGDPVPCHGFGTDTDHPGYFDIGLLHEVLHTLGFAPSCAPHVTQVDHVNDSPTDIMYAPDATHTGYWDPLNAVLDYNHDDYYGAHIQGCLDLANSPYLTPVHSVSVTVTGPGAVTSNPPGIECPSTTCTGTFPGSVTLTAAPAAGMTFAGWTGACNGASSACLIPNGGSVTATFTEPAPPAGPSPGCTVPSVKGKTLVAARQALRSNRCSTGTIRRAYSTTVKAGRVISQNPAAGKRFAAGRKINLVVSRGRRG
jgi:hypothetical protein